MSTTAEATTKTTRRERTSTTTSEETEVTITTTTTFAPTRTLTRTQKSTLEAEATSEVTLWPPRPTKTVDEEDTKTEKSTLTEDRTVTSTKTEPTTLLSVTKEVTTHTERDTLLTHQITVQLPTASSTTTDRDNVLGNAQDIDEDAGSVQEVLSPGAMGGIIAAAVVLCIVLAVMAFVFFRRRAAKRKSSSEVRPVSSNDGSTSDKDYTPVAMTSPGGQDPFAPFGGRADKVKPFTAQPTTLPEAPIHEIEDTSIGLVELPGQGVVSPAEVTEPRGPSRLPGTRREDPRATLNATVNDRGRPAFVNYWSSYQ
ncbi:hypothetical protein LIA77_01191 [Sarocladium implicatum]|nr:hypothetical protein LIA77_01191 [Sarocladium implicatum]